MGHDGAMFRKVFALALVLVLVAICTRRPFDVRTGEKLPNTCAAAQFAATVEELDDMAVSRDQVLARIEALPVDEPTEYVMRWKQEIDLLRELASKADRVAAPRCLHHAKELFEQYLEQSLHAAGLRAPDRDFDDYRRARETADIIRGQYAGEVRLQEKNRL